MRRNEQSAVEIAVRLLHFRGAKAAWSPGEDPPDAWIVSDEIRRPAEVTRVTHHLRRGGRRWPEPMVYHSLGAAARRVAKKLLADARVQGEFVLHTQPVDDLRAAEGEIVLRALDYCVASAVAPTAPPIAVFGRAWGSRWSISKVGDRDTCVRWTVSLYGIGLEQGTWRRMLRDELSERAGAKAHIPRRFGDSGVLILEDWFHYAEDDEWRELLPTRLVKEWHTIVRVRGPHEARILYTANACLK